jgi:hypothetical protein
MCPASPAAVIAASVRNLAGTTENRIGGPGAIFLIFAQNTPQIFRQFEKIKFT